MRARRLAGRWVLPVEGPPIPDGAVLIGDDGRIRAVGPGAEVACPPEAPAEAFGDAIIIPGLVNAHTHLELTGIVGPSPDVEFANWIRQLRGRKAARDPGEWENAARRGLAECFASGVTTVADTGDSGAVVQALAEAGGSGIAYQEVFGPHPGQAAAGLAGLRDRVTALSSYAAARVRLGVSPHAPYTVSGPLYAAVAEWAGQERLPLAVHLAESRAESELLVAGTGAFADAWRERGIAPVAPPGRSPVAWLESHGVLGPCTLCIHVVQAGPDDVARLARAGCAVAHCPRSNRAHGHGDAPLDRFLDAGLRVGLGTDSVASVGTLDLLAEARMARELAELGADAALELCTLGAARALGLEGEIGSLRAGKWGDCAVIRLPASALGRPPAEQVLASGPADVLATFLGGREVYRAHPLATGPSR